MRILRYILLFLLVVVVVVAVGAGVTYNRWTQGPLPQHNGSLTVAGLNADVEVLRDTYGVPHIYASTTHDLFFAQGYTQAQDRWWQMEFWRHIGAGRIGELTGKTKSVLGSDLFIRSSGWYASAEDDYTALDDEAKVILQAFADGVNAYITTRSAGELAFEYNVLGVTGVKIPIEPWDPIDTLVWTKVMSWDLGGNMSEEQDFSELLSAVGEDMLADYAPDFPYDSKPTIIQTDDLPPAGMPFDAAFEGQEAGTPVITEWAGNFQNTGLVFGKGDGIGSNNWVVAGSRTVSGKPLLANDPHLGIQMPSIWYEIGLHCQPVTAECPFDVRGLAFASVPGVVIGHNANIAWGVTNIGWDTQDLYIIKPAPDNPLQYEWNGEWRDMTVRSEEIRFGDGEDPITLDIRVTHLGPIINDYQMNDDGTIGGYNDKPLALHWTSYEPSTLVMAILGLNTARNWEDFREAASDWDTAAQNMVYADIEGNIGYQTPGRVPIRAAGHTGLLPIDGSTDQYEWKGYVPFENLPSVYNPARGYIATANQALVPEEYYAQLAETLGDTYGADSHYTFGYYWAFGYRGQRIVEMLEASDKHDFESFRTIQGDNKLIFAEEITPALQAMTFDDASLNEIRDWMLAWDYQLHMDSPQAALFMAFWQRFGHAIYDDQAGFEVSGGGINMWATVNLLKDPQNVWWDDMGTEDVTETPQMVAEQSLRAAYDELMKAQGSDRTKWAWGKMHTATFESNPLGFSGIGPVENIVNRGPVMTSGGTDTVNSTSWNGGYLDDKTGWQADYTVRAVPSMRMIVDMSDLSKSMIVHTTGQSGHPFSKNYGDMIEAWRLLDYHPMLWTREQVDANLASTLILTPGG